MAWLSPNSTSMKPCRIHSICSLALIFTLLSLSHPARGDINGDAQALLAFKQNVSMSIPSWNESGIADICTSWKGVYCSSSSSPRVIQLRLPGRSIYGQIPPQTLGNLDALEVLSLHHNGLLGPLPQDLTNCSALRELYLNNNRFSGAIALDFSAWPRLTKLDLSFNNFSGQIPPSLSNSTNLQVLFLQDNAFSGSISSLGALRLGRLNVSNNRLNGSIPSTLSQFPTESFAGNLDLCGQPLPACALPPVSEPTPVAEPASESGNNNGNANKLSAGAIAGIVVAAAVACTVALCVLFLLFARKKRKQGHAEDLYSDGRAEFESKTKGGAMDVNNTSREAAMNRKGSGKSGLNEGATNYNINNKLVFMGDGKKTFDLDDLLRASAEVLGKGSLGTSYKAHIDEGHPVSVKRFREVATEREDTCKHIEMLGALRHPNLVPLRAYFFAPKGKLLVSDYMPKGNLTTLLHGKRGEVKTCLSWDARLEIAGGAAKAVVFLHSKKIVHGNIKSTNVLMDSDNAPRLSDYGLVQLMPKEPASNHRPNAYTPPEARNDLRKITYKGDVYAFGVLLLELVTGLSPYDGENSMDDLVQWVQGHFPQQVDRVLDPLLNADSDDKLQDEMISLLNIALPCVSSSPEKRPHMVEVVSSIEHLRKREVGPESTDFYFTEAV